MIIFTLSVLFSHANVWEVYQSVNMGIIRANLRPCFQVKSVVKNTPSGSHLEQIEA